MIKPIVLFGDPILRKQATDYKPEEELSKLIQDLWDTMYNATGAGLAAPQINLSKRIFVIDLLDQEWKQVFINPKILSYGNEQSSMVEGCLSLPGISGKVIRPSEIVIEYYDENLNHKIKTFKGIRSRVIQHEYDHLEGRLWVDRIDPSESIKYVSDLTKITKRKVTVKYPII